jgi:phosphoribosyl 1,2-cyclic phosphodiesterase
VRVFVCGVRGSTPAPGQEFARYGGHTSCVALAHDGQPPSLVLDAGTGIRRVSQLLEGLPFQGTILLGHLHWDHTQGLPFFAAGDHPGARVDVFVPAQGDAEAVLARAMSPPHFPITPSELRGRWRFQSLEPGDHAIEGFSVLAMDIPHKGGRTFGYRVSDSKSSVAYLSDHCPTRRGPGPTGLGEYHDAAVTLVRDCDLLLHDAQYTDEELPARASFGHAAISYAVGLAETAGAKRLRLFHHEPSRTDDAIDSLVTAHQRPPLEVDAAAEGAVIDLPGP